MENKKINFEIAWAYMPLDKKDLNSMPKRHRKRPYLLCMDKGSFYYAFPCTTQVQNYENTNDNEKIVTIYPKHMIELFEVYMLPKSNVIGYPTPICSKDTNEIIKKVNVTIRNKKFPNDFKEYFKKLDYYCDENDIIKIDNEIYVIIDSNDDEFFVHKVYSYPVNNSVLIEMGRTKNYVDLSKIYTFKKDCQHKYCNRINKCMFGNESSLKDYLLTLPILTKQKDYSIINNVDPGMVVDFTTEYDSLRMVVLKVDNFDITALCGKSYEKYNEFNLVHIDTDTIKSFKIISNISNYRLNNLLNEHIRNDKKVLKRKYQK